MLATAAGGAERPRLELSLLRWPRSSEGTPAARSDYVDAVGRDYVLQAREMHRDDLADRVDGHVTPADDGGWWLQYCFFHLYNDKALLGIARPRRPATRKLPRTSASVRAVFPTSYGASHGAH